MSMFDSFKRLLGLKKTPAPRKAAAPMAETFSILDTGSPEGRRGHSGQFAKAVERRRTRRKIGRKSKQINRKIMSK